MSSPQSLEEALNRMKASTDRLGKLNKKGKATIERIAELNRKERKILKKVLRK